MDLVRDIDSLTYFKRNTAAVLEQLKTSGEPMVLTVNGRAELVVQDAASYQRLLDHIDRAEAIDGIRRGLKSFEEGKGKPAMKALRELKRRHGIQG